MRGLGLGFTNPGGTGGKWDMSVFWLWWCWGECVGFFGPSLVGWGGVKSVFVVSLDYFC